jgi:hypothetical protein
MWPRGYGARFKFEVSFRPLEISGSERSEGSNPSITIMSFFDSSISLFNSSISCYGSQPTDKRECSPVQSLYVVELNHYAHA